MHIIGPNCLWTCISKNMRLCEHHLIGCRGVLITFVAECSSSGMLFNPESRCTEVYIGCVPAVYLTLIYVCMPAFSRGRNKSCSHDRPAVRTRLSRDLLP